MPKMDDDLKQSLIDLIKVVQKDQYSGPFLKPVDHIALGIPDYPQVIKNPMDIQTLLNNLKKDKYENP